MIYITEYIGADKAQVIEKLEQYDDVTFANKSDNRFARNEIAKMRKVPNGRYFIPVGEYRYKLFEICTDEERETFLRVQVTQMNSHYFDTLKPLMDRIGKHRMNELYEGGLFGRKEEK